MQAARASQSSSPIEHLSVFVVLLPGYNEVGGNPKLLRYIRFFGICELLKKNIGDKVQIY